MDEVVFDSSFEVNKTNNYKLSIQLKLDGFSFFISNASTNKIIAYKTEAKKISNTKLIARHLHDWIKTNEILQETFLNVEVIIHSEKFTIVPEFFFEKKQIDNQILPLFEKTENEQIIANNLPDEKSKLVFATQNSIFDTIKSYFSEVEIIHPIKILLAKNMDVENFYTLILYEIQESMYILIKEKQGLILANSFTFEHENDILYFVLTTLKQLKISTNHVTVFAGGKRSTEDFKQLFSKYFNKILSIPALPQINHELLTPSFDTSLI